MKSASLIPASLITLLIVVSASPLGISSAIAMGTPETKCYRISSDDSPSAIEVNESRTHTWCYRQVHNPAGSRLIYHVDGKGRTQPELSFLVERDGTIVHASLKQGERTVHRLRASWNPMGIPLQPPADAVRVKTPITPMGANESAEGALEILTSPNSAVEEIALRSGGEYNVSVAPQLMPWRGYWYPHSSGRLHHGSNSPMAKLDRMIEVRTGKKGGAQRWEANNHDYTGVNWAGHCNGWAAAAVLRKEPRQPWTDPISKVTFNVADLKGILMERDYCPITLFFGKRNRGGGSGAGDIPALDFHNLISYYVGKLGKPIQMDLMSTSPVENRVVSGYKMIVAQEQPNVFKIDATLKIHGYDSKHTDDVGEAPFFERVYRYRVWTDPTGTPIKGQWISSNPDFIWIPIAPGSCSSGNPHVTEAVAEALGKPVNFPPW